MRIYERNNTQIFVKMEMSHAWAVFSAILITILGGLLFYCIHETCGKYLELRAIGCAKFICIPLCCFKRNEDYF